MKKRNILTESLAAITLSVAGLTTTNLIKNNDVQASIVKNDVAIYRVYVSTSVYNNYQNGQATGQVLAPNTSWKVIRTAYDAQGNKWYDLGKNQWVKVAAQTTNNSQSNKYQVTESYRYQGQRYNVYGNYRDNQSYQAVNYSQNTQQQSASRNANYTSSATGSEASDKAWIASHESGGSYIAHNGRYIGKYQLDSTYLHGDYSAANQERTADRYVHNRYGTWAAAKTHWQIHGWY